MNFFIHVYQIALVVQLNDKITYHKNIDLINKHKSDIIQKDVIYGSIGKKDDTVHKRTVSK